MRIPTSSGSSETSQTYNVLFLTPFPQAPTYLLPNIMPVTHYLVSTCHVHPSILMRPHATPLKTQAGWHSLAMRGGIGCTHPRALAPHIHAHSTTQHRRQHRPGRRSIAASAGVSSSDARRLSPENFTEKAWAAVVAAPDAAKAYGQQVVETEHLLKVGGVWHRRWTS